MTKRPLVPVIHEAHRAGLIECKLCEDGFRRVDGFHIGSQSKGMIHNEPCNRVFATYGGTAQPARLHRRGGTNDDLPLQVPRTTYF